VAALALLLMLEERIMKPLLFRKIEKLHEMRMSGSLAHHQGKIYYFLNACKEMVNFFCIPASLPSAPIRGYNAPS
jgi:hypothetical protein